MDAKEISDKLAYMRADIDNFQDLLGSDYTMLAGWIRSVERQVSDVNTELLKVQGANRLNEFIAGNSTTKPQVATFVVGAAVGVIVFQLISVKRQDKRYAKMRAHSQTEQ